MAFCPCKVKHDLSVNAVFRHFGARLHSDAMGNAANNENAHDDFDTAEMQHYG